MAVKTLVFVDGVNALIRSFAAYPDLRSPSGAPTGAAYGVVNRIREACERFDPSRVVCVWDGGRSSWRRKVWPKYKDRPPTSDAAGDPASPLHDCFVQKPVLLELLRDVGVDQIQVKGVEADDLIASGVLEGAFGAYDDAVIMSTDRDFYQLLSERVSIWTATGKDPRAVTLATFAKDPSTKGMTTPEMWHAYKIVNGDGLESPRVPGLSGLKKFELVWAVFQHMGLGFSDPLDFFLAEDVGGAALRARGATAGKKDAKRYAKIIEAVVERWGDLERNTMLMDLRFAVRMLPKSLNGSPRIELGMWDERAAERTCSRLNFQSALRRWTDWCRSFERLKERKVGG